MTDNKATTQIEETEFADFFDRKVLTVRLPKVNKRAEEITY